MAFVIPWKEVGKYGFATVACFFLGYYYRVDVVLPAREQAKSLISINEKQAETQDRQTAILAKMGDDIGQIKRDQQKFPAVAERMP